MEDKKVSNVQFVVGSNTGHDGTIFHSLSTDAPQSSFRSVEMYTTTKLTSSLLLKIKQRDRLKNQKKRKTPTNRQKDTRRDR
jgi:hypothetical protein